MAAKAKTSTAFPGVTDVQSRLRSLQREGGRLATRFRKEVGGMIPKDQRKALDDLVTHARRLRKDFQKRAEKAVKTLETRAEKFMKDIETRAEKGVEPVIRRLNLPLRSDLASLEKRLAAIERKVDGLVRDRAA